MARKSKKVSARDKQVKYWDREVERLKRVYHMSDPGRYYWGFEVIVDFEEGTQVSSGNLTSEEIRETVSGLHMDIADSLNGVDSVKEVWIYPVYEVLEETYDPETDEYTYSPPSQSDAYSDYDQEPIWSWSLDNHTNRVAGGYSTLPLFYNASDTPGHSGWVYADPRYSS